MIAKRLSLILIIVTMALLGLVSSSALAKEIVEGTLAGPGLAGEIGLANPQDLEVASAPWFNLESAVPPANLKTATYYVIRLVVSEEEQIAGKITFHYYPGTDDQPGYFLFADCQGCASNAQTWYRIRDQEDLALRQLLVSLGAPAALIQSADQARPELNGASSSLAAGSSTVNALRQQRSLLNLAILPALVLSLAIIAFLRKRWQKLA
jgi:hypothetical protein